MPEDQIKLQKAIFAMEGIEGLLGHIYAQLDTACTGEEQDYRDPRDNMERCMQMVLGQVMEAWTHAGKAKKRLIALAESSSSPEEK